MKEILKWGFSVWESYWGEGFYQYLFITAVIILAVWGFVFRKREERGALWYVLIASLIFFCPVTAKIISICIGENVYWRVLWILPAIPVIAYGMTRIVTLCRFLILKIVLMICMVAVIIFCGKGMMKAENYVQVSNYQQVPDEVAIICNMINAERGDETVKIAVEDYLAAYIRVYDPSFFMPYSRGGNGAQNKECKELYNLLTSGSEDYVRIAEIAKNQDCNYIVLRESANSLENMENQGFEKIGFIAIYEIYHLKND